MLGGQGLPLSAAVSSAELLPPPTPAVPRWPHGRRDGLRTRLQRTQHRRVPRQRRQGGRPVRGLPPAHPDLDRRQERDRTRESDRLLRHRRHDLRRRFGSRVATPAPAGCSTFALPPPSRSRSAAHPRKPPSRANSRGPSATASTTSSSSRRLASASTRRRPTGSFRCSSSPTAEQVKGLRPHPASAEGVWGPSRWCVNCRAAGGSAGRCGATSAPGPSYSGSAAMQLECSNGCHHCPRHPG